MFCAGRAEVRKVFDVKDPGTNLKSQIKNCRVKPALGRARFGGEQEGSHADAIDLGNAKVRTHAKIKLSEGRLFPVPTGVDETTVGWHGELL